MVHQILPRRGRDGVRQFRADRIEGFAQVRNRKTISGRGGVPVDARGQFNLVKRQPAHMPQNDHFPEPNGQPIHRPGKIRIRRRREVIPRTQCDVFTPRGIAAVRAEPVERSPPRDLRKPRIQVPHSRQLALRHGQNPAERGLNNIFRILFSSPRPEDRPGVRNQPSRVSMPERARGELIAVPGREKKLDALVGHVG